MAKTLTEKAVNLFDGETDIQEKLKAFYQIRDLMTKCLIAFQQQLQDKASEFQEIIDDVKQKE